MKMMLDIDIKSPVNKISYRDKIFVIGSCFTEHIGGRLQHLKFRVLQNPNGILFDPLSVSSNLQSYINNKRYTEDDLFYLNELWQSWHHHSRFSGLAKEEVLDKINASQLEAHNFLKEAGWLIMTLGSSFSYQLTSNSQFVANCHRAPGQWFRKHLTGIDETVKTFDETILQLSQFNPGLKIVFTISPVRHIRDGVIENNRSKARLIEAVHQLVNKYQHASYFPAYEIVIDVLRDYRFYDVDLVHPNYPATEFVFKKFTDSYIDEESHMLMEDIKKIVTAYRHKPFQPTSNAHLSFLKKNLEQAIQVQQKLPFIDFEREITYFKGEA